MSAADVIRFKEAEGLDFERFRLAVGKSIRERLVSDSDPDVVATQVYRDVLEPELLQIEARLTRARAALSVKAAVQLGIGTVTTSIGLITGLPPLIATGLAAMGATPVHAAKYIDDSKEVKLSDMYFLWHAAVHEHSNGDKVRRRQNIRRRSRG